MDENGFLLSKYYGADATHANADYGRLILDEIEIMIGAKFKGWQSFEADVK